MAMTTGVHVTHSEALNGQVCKEKWGLISRDPHGSPFLRLSHNTSLAATVPQHESCGCDNKGQNATRLLVNRLNRSAITARYQLSPRSRGRIAASRIRTCAGEPN